MGKIKLEKRSGPAHHGSSIARVVVAVTLPVAAGPRAEVVDAVGRREAVTRGGAPGSKVAEES
mgnify:CR=1 FL=1